MIASPLDPLREMASALGAGFVAVPPCPLSIGSPQGADDVWRNSAVLEEWRATNAEGEARPAIVVAVWPDEHVSAAFTETSPNEFARRSEWPFAAWYAALGIAARRAADDGAIVALVERPSPLDGAGWAPESGAADAVEALVRSLARSEGHRGVRVNCVTTPARLAPTTVIAPPPSLPRFPGRVDHEVTQAVRMLLGPGVAGVTGTVVHADCGRSWR